MEGANQDVIATQREYEMKCSLNNNKKAPQYKGVGQNLYQGSGSWCLVAHSQDDNVKKQRGAGRCRAFFLTSQTELIHFIGCLFTYRKSGNWMILWNTTECRHTLENHKNRNGSFLVFLKGKGVFWALSMAQGAELIG